ncbi:hypothetical protein GCM10007978_24250 [Shewanella hanedai]|uniref:Uncharacterized protein n=1 Tax=Shewanella hanedai TaxID=25 RepID=A0A553JMZ5_SHEHA|nr:hypothetical protein [Shewanella hanedai]TRY13839.1 hypothetical protein FN961_13050 [Shewanella hanedai]GGI85739.1 hypothetical protein GCM10007978_24250 [Shewanella hanedai]
MSKIEIVYIGNKPIKKDTVTCSRLVFSRHDPVAVDNDVGQRLLEYPTVWVLKDNLGEVLKKQEQQDQLLAEAKAVEAANQAKQQKDESYLVTINDEEIDIAKYSSRQLDTLVEAEDLVITVPKKPVQPYRDAVRDSLRNEAESTDAIRGE